MTPTTSRVLRRLSVLLVLSACGGIVTNDREPPDRETPSGSGGATANATGGRPSGHAGFGFAGEGDAGPDGGDPGDPALYVAGPQGQDAKTCGARSRPCATIATGLTNAKARGKTIVRVAEGTYVEAIELFAGVRVEGGWSFDDGEWRAIDGARARESVILRAPDSSSFTVLASDLGGAAQLALLTVRSKESAGPGESLYGVVARGSTTNLVLEDLKVVVADAGKGLDGERGADGAVGNAAGCDSPSNGADGAPAVPPSGSPASGSFTWEGYLPGDGERGVDGEAGHNGTEPTLLSTCVRDCGTCVSSTGSECTTIADSCGSPGRPGCGGGGGRGGGAGLGGGSSIAVYVWGATVSILGGVFEAGDGGDGGRAGVPGSGGPGTPGVAGKPATTRCTRCEPGYEGSAASTSIFTCQDVDVGVGSPGGPGGPGGHGAEGSIGSSGRGGSSCTVYQSPNASVTTSSTAELSFGAPGNNAADDGPGTSGRICT